MRYHSYQATVLVKADHARYIASLFNLFLCNFCNNYSLLGRSQHEQTLAFVLTIEIL